MNTECNAVIHGGSRFEQPTWCENLAVPGTEYCEEHVEEIEEEDPMDYRPFAHGLTVRNMRPTQKHRLAISPGILGTVYAMNAAGEIRYFDADYEGAREFAGLNDAIDIRYARPIGPYRFVKSGAYWGNPGVKDRCYWVKDVK